MQILNAKGLDGKSGGAQWRDLRFSGPYLEMFFDRAYPDFSVEGPAVLSAITHTPSYSLQFFLRVGLATGDP
jgi:hypothetical protein